MKTVRSGQAPDQHRQGRHAEGRRRTLSSRRGDSVTITTGDASITMKKDGTIIIKGKDITIEGSGKINVKASSDIVMKGSKIVRTEDALHERSPTASGLAERPTNPAGEELEQLLEAPLDATAADLSHRAAAD